MGADAVGRPPLPAWPTPAIQIVQLHDGPRTGILPRGLLMIDDSREDPAASVTADGLYRLCSVARRTPQG